MSGRARPSLSARSARRSGFQWVRALSARRGGSWQARHALWRIRNGGAWAPVRLPMGSEPCRPAAEDRGGLGTCCGASVAAAPGRRCGFQWGQSPVGRPRRIVAGSARVVALSVTAAPGAGAASNGVRALSAGRGVIVAGSARVVDGSATATAPRARDSSGEGRARPGSGRARPSAEVLGQGAASSEKRANPRCRFPSMVWILPPIQSEFEPMTLTVHTPTKFSP